MSISRPLLNLLLAWACCCLGSPLPAQTGVFGSKHDLSYIYQRQTTMHGTAISNYAQVCVFCHTPHHSSAALGAPLWNRQLPDAASFIPYSSPTLVSPSEAPRAKSLVCLSCHDGSIAADTVLNMPGRGLVNADFPLSVSAGISSAHARMNVTKAPGNCGYCHSGSGHPRASKRVENYFGKDLSGHHPVSVIYPSGGQAFQPPAALPGAGLRLPDGRVECTSCHAVHDPTHAPFLRKSNNQSALCLSCHRK